VTLWCDVDYSGMASKQLRVAKCQCGAVPGEACRGGSTSSRRCLLSCRRRPASNRRGWRRPATAAGCPLAASSPARRVASARRPAARCECEWFRRFQQRNEGICKYWDASIATWNTRPDLHGPEKVVAVIVNVPSDGTRSTAESASQAALHASRNARVSSVEPSPTAPYSRTSNTHGSSGCTGVAGSDGTMPVGGGRATGWVSSSEGGGNAGDDTTEPEPPFPPPLCRPPPPPCDGFLW
jgi:hypothetical protein